MDALRARYPDDPFFEQGQEEADFGGTHEQPGTGTRTGSGYTYM